MHITQNSTQTCTRGKVTPFSTGKYYTNPIRTGKRCTNARANVAPHASKPKTHILFTLFSLCAPARLRIKTKARKPADGMWEPSAIVSVIFAPTVYLVKPSVKVFEDYLLSTLLRDLLRFLGHFCGYFSFLKNCENKIKNWGGIWIKKIDD